MMRKKEIDYETSLAKMQRFMIADVDGMYTLMLRNFLPAIVGTNDWNSKSKKEVLPVFVSASDEAFCLLCLENSWDHWYDLVEGKLHKDKFDRKNRELAAEGNDPMDAGMEARGCKYTAGGSGIKESQGWKKEGIERYNDLIDAIRTARKTDKGTAYYKKMLEAIKQECNIKQSRKRKTREAMPVAETDFGPPRAVTKDSLVKKGYDVTEVDGYFCYYHTLLGENVRIKMDAMVSV